MASRPSAAWTGTIAFPELNLKIDSWLYSSEQRGRKPLPVMLVHATCITPIGGPVAETGAEQAAGGAKARTRGAGGRASAPAAAQLGAPLHCPRCRKIVHLPEIARGVDVPGVGRILITDDELASLKATKQDAVEASIIQDPTSVIASLGLGRRLWVMPKPVSVDTYYLLLTVLQQSERVGFIPEIVLDERPYVLVVRPLATDPAVFGTSMTVLVADEFKDTDRLKSPAEFERLPAQPPQLQARRVAALVKQARATTATVDLSVCVNPEFRKFQELLARKIRER